MSKKTKVIMLFITVIIIICVIVITMNFRNKGDINTTITTVNSMYTVKEYNGKVAIFKGNGNGPIEIFNTFTESLPKHDREMLRKGIKANGNEELQKIIEDYAR